MMQSNRNNAARSNQPYQMKNAYKRSNSAPKLRVQGLRPAQFEGATSGGAIMHRPATAQRSQPQYRGVTAQNYSVGTDGRSSPGEKQRYHRQLPFRPSGALEPDRASPTTTPTRSRYWYSQSQEAGDRDVMRGTMPIEEHQPAIRPTSTEYNERFIQYDVSQRQKTSPQRPSISNLHSYAVAMNTADWQSESKRNFPAHVMEEDPAALSPAGTVSSRGLRNMAATMSWDLVARSTEAEKKEPANRKGDLVRQPSPIKQRLTEHSVNFQWPPAEKGQIYSPSRGIGLPGSKYAYKSEYDDKLAELRMKQRQITVPEKPAGKPSKEAPLVEPPKQQYYHYDMGDSEYKMKFKEWPLEGTGGVQNDENVGRRTGSLVFPTQAKDAYSRLRQSSVYRDSFPAYHVDEIAGSTNASIEFARGGGGGDPKPPSFAWSLLDGEAPKIPHEPQPPLASQMGESEYTKKFKWPQGEAYAKPALPARTTTEQAGGGPTISDTLFPVVEYATDNIKPLFSEYREQYTEKETVGGLLRSPVTTRRDAGAPNQFAWPRSDGRLVVDEEEESSRVKRLKPATGDWSEHTSQYKWITGDDHFLVKKADENHDRKIGQVFALDDEEGVRGKWQSEYDQQSAAALQSRQKEVSFVAGVPTASRAKVPSNFAWGDELIPPPPPSPVFKAVRKVTDAHFRSEYDDKFMPWRAAPAEMIRPPPAAPELNLFEESSGPLQRIKDKQAGGGATSEYAERFKKFDAASGAAQHPQGHGRADSSIPPQFAWPLGEPPVQPAPAPMKPSKPMERSIAETSFRWPTATVPTKSFKPDKDPHSSTEPPMAVIDDSKDVDKWRSESRKQAQDILNASTAPHVAGIISVRDEDVPSFFAWADQMMEGKKSAASSAPVRPALLPVEAVNSEHREKFHLHPDAQPATLMKPTVQEKDLNVFASESDSKASVMRSEYDANFTNKQRETAAATAGDGIAGKRATTQEFRPPQFAWPLVDPAASTVTPVVRKLTVPFKETSEYDSKFMWPSATAAAVAAAPSKPPANTVDHFETTATLLDTDQEGKSSSSQWRSEYDAKNQEMRIRQEELAASDKKLAAHVIKPNHGMEEAPAFFAWSALESQAEQSAPPPAPAPRAASLIAPDTSEYRDRFNFANPKSVAAQPVFGISTKAMMDSSSHVGELLKNQPVKKVMASEYDAQFNLANAVHDEVNQPKIITRKDMIKPSLQHTNLDKHSAGQPLLPPPPPFPPGTHVCTKKMELTTEAGTQYKWPQPLTAPPSTAPLGGGGGSKANRHRGSDPNKENMSNTLNISHLLEASSTGPTASNKQPTRFQTGTTEYRKQFSWPEAARKPNDVERERAGSDNMSSADGTSPKKNKGMTRQQQLRAKAKHYRLMSMKGARQPGILAQRSPGGAVLSSTFGRAERMPGTKKPAAGLSTANNKTTRRLMNTSGFDADSGSGDRGYDTDDYAVVEAPVEDRTDAAAATAHTTTASTAYSADSLDQRKVSSSQRSPVSIADDSARASSPGRLGEAVPYSTIPGLREYEPNYRARSAPAMRRLSQGIVSSTGGGLELHRAGMYVDQGRSNPVLINQRFPGVSDRQTSRWSTESRDNFRSPTRRVGLTLRA